MTSPDWQMAFFGLGLAFIGCIEILSHVIARLKISNKNTTRDQDGQKTNTNIVTLIAQCLFAIGAALGFIMVAGALFF